MTDRTTAQTYAKKVSFFNLLKQQRVVIPRLQRDFALGRPECEDMRGRFLVKLKQILDRKEEGAALGLDFIYGYREDDAFYPIDGQQRLTVLWLMHWFIALKTGRLADEDTAELLRHFSYQTRGSSASFCQKLCRPENFSLDAIAESGCGLADFIKDRIWFTASWIEDPTVAGILRTISEYNKPSDKKMPASNLEALFADYDASKFEESWQFLSSENCPLAFYVLDISSYAIGDELYIKMNSRGKLLSGFENFKAELIAYAEKEAHSLARDSNKWQEIAYALVLKLDTEYVDIFWNNNRPSAGGVSDNAADAAFLAFIKRYCLSKMLLEDVFRCTEDESRCTDNYEALRKNELTYDSLELFKYFVADDGTRHLPLDFFTDLIKILDACSGLLRTTAGSHPGRFWPHAPWDPDFEFIPKFKNQQLPSLNFRQQAVFTGICWYLKFGASESQMRFSSLDKWLRIVWNLTSGINEDGSYLISNITILRETTKLLKLIDSHDPYQSLCSLRLGSQDECFNVSYNGVEVQISQWLYKSLKEEQEKASKILKSGEDFEDLIRDAECFNTWAWKGKEESAKGTYLFQGRIRFLYADRAGRVDWSSFERKWQNAQLLLRDDYVVKEKHLYNSEPGVREHIADDNQSRSLKILLGLIGTDLLTLSNQSLRDKINSCVKNEGCERECIDYSKENCCCPHCELLRKWYAVMVYHPVLLSSRRETWMYLLLHEELCAEVDRFLRKNDKDFNEILKQQLPKIPFKNKNSKIVPQGGNPAYTIINVFYVLTHSRLIAELRYFENSNWKNSVKNARIVYQGEGLMIHAKNQRSWICLNDRYRDRILQSEVIEPEWDINYNVIDFDGNADVGLLFETRDIFFSYYMKDKRHHFKWEYWSDAVCLLDDKWQYVDEAYFYVGEESRYKYWEKDPKLGAVISIQKFECELKKLIKQYGENL